jgi:hypothetical protein
MGNYKLTKAIDQLESTNKTIETIAKVLTEAGLTIEESSYVMETVKGRITYLLNRTARTLEENINRAFRKPFGVDFSEQIVLLDIDDVLTK